MNKLPLAISFLLILAAGLPAQKATPTPPVDDDVVKISTNLIQLDVTVTDRNGKPVTDLRRDEIEIYENGEKQEITNFTFISGARPNGPAIRKNQNDANVVEVPVPVRSLKPEQIRRTIALVVDDLGLSFESIYQVRRALRNYVDKQMRDGDLVAIIRTGAGIGALQQFSSDKNFLYGVIEKIRWNPRGRAGIGPLAPIEDLPNSIRQEDAEDRQIREEFENSVGDFQDGVFKTGTLGGLQYIVNGMSELPGRKSVILFSDGFSVRNRTDRSSAVGVMDYLNRLIEAANRASVVFYTIDARGLLDSGVTAADKIDPSPQRISQVLSQRSREITENQEGLQILAKETGGLAYINRNRLDEGIRDVLEDQSYYLVGYQPDTDTFDPNKRRFNKIEVRVSRPGANARYRSGFFNVQDRSPVRYDAGQTPGRQLNNAIISPFGAKDISLRLNTLFGNNVYGSFVTSLLHIDASDLKFTDGADGRKHAAIDILAISFGDNGVPEDNVAKNFTFDVKPDVLDQVRRDGFVCNFTFPVKKPGSYQFRVAVRDTQAQTVGSASQFIDIPDPKKKRLNLSGVLLEKFTPEQWKLFTGGAVGPDIVSRANEPTDPIADSAIRRFRRGGVLRYGFQVFNARLDSLGRPLLSARIRLFRDDQLVLDGKPQPVTYQGQTDLQRIQANGALDLSGNITPGEYILQIIVTDELAKGKQKVSAQVVQFDVIE